MSPQRHAAARDFLLTRARPLERGLYHFEFEHGPAADAVSALSAFQNQDGGFGHALEPDFRLPASSALATSIGLQHLSRLPAELARERALHALSYVAETYDPGRQGWQKVPPAVADYPRAFWWEPEQPEDVEANWANPGAELVGYIYEVPGSAAEPLRESLTRRAFAWLDAHERALEMHDLLCYLRLARRLPADLKQDLEQRLARHVREVVATDQKAWAEYALQPVQVAPDPEALYTELLGPAIAANLDYLIAEQGADGAWEPTWNWGRFPEEWERAREEWKGILTLENLRLLRSYGRLPA